MNVSFVVVLGVIVAGALLISLLVRRPLVVAALLGTAMLVVGMSWLMRTDAARQRLVLVENAELQRALAAAQRAEVQLVVPTPPVPLAAWWVHDVNVAQTAAFEGGHGGVLAGSGILLLAYAVLRGFTRRSRRSAS